MGLDWNPAPKPKPGHEEEFRRIFLATQSAPDALQGRLRDRFEEITTTAFETLGVPQVGFDVAADDWARSVAFPLRVDKALSLEVFLRNMRGFRVLALVPACDGIPRFSNGSAGGDVEAYAFRGQFLTDCTEIIGDELLASAYVSKMSDETMIYGANLLRKASDFAAARKIDIATVRLAEDPDSIEFRLDVVFSAGRWCRFWAERGHWLEAYW